jgi:hypothetical protein
MMRSVEALGFALAVWGAAGCGNETIPIATVGDASVDAGAVTCTLSDAGIELGTPCQDGEFCETKICGATVGTCTTIPPDASCDGADYDPECGCNGVSYFNGCLRRAAKINASAATACDLQSGPGPNSICDPSALPLGNLGCPGGSGSNACAFISPSFFSVALGDGGFNLHSLACTAQPPDPRKIGSCWVLPLACPATSSSYFCTCLGQRLDACAAIKSGGILLPCDSPDASDD